MHADLRLFAPENVEISAVGIVFKQDGRPDTSVDGITDHLQVHDDAIAAQAVALNKTKVELGGARLRDVVQCREAESLAAPHIGTWARISA